MRKQKCPLYVNQLRAGTIITKFIQFLYNGIIILIMIKLAFTNGLLIARWSLFTVSRVPLSKQTASKR